MLVAVGACCLAILPASRSLADPSALQQKWKWSGHHPCPWRHGGGRWKHPTGPFGWPQMGKWHPKGVPLGKLFHQTDKDHSGNIEAAELQSLSDALRRRFNMSAPQFERVYGEAFGSSLDFRTFKTLAGVLFVFEMADVDHDGVLAGQELSLQGFALAEELKHLPMPEGSFRKLMHEADTDDLEGLSAAELKAFLESVQDYQLGPRLMGVWFKLDQDRNDVLQGKELEELPHELESSLSLSQKYVKPMLGEPEEMDRRDFKELVFKAWGGPPMQHLSGPPVLVLFRKCDRDRSLFVEEEELRRLPRGHFKDVDVKSLASSADGDGDKKLNPAEFTAFLKAALKEHASPHPAAPQREHKLPAAPSEKRGPQTEAALFEDLDRNRDNAIDGDEVDKMSGRLLKLFEVNENLYNSLLMAADLDADAELSRGEFEELVRALNAMPRPGGTAMARKDLLKE